MNARPLLDRVALALAEHRLEAIVIGNAGAALHGAPVTTLDIDFLFRKTPTNMRKLKAVARSLGASVFQPYYPTSSMYRVIGDDDGFQLDFLVSIHGGRSFASLRSRATRVELGRSSLLVADLRDIVKSKRSAGHIPRIAPSSMSSKPRSPRSKKPSREAVLRALARESEGDLLAQIRRLLALPPNQRTHFLRVRLPGGGSCL